MDEEKDNQDLIAWLENICQREFGLIDILVVNFIDNISDPELARKLLKILKKLNEHLPELVVDQFLRNKKFPSAIVSYIDRTPLETIAGDCFILLANVFNDVTDFTEGFVKKILAAMDYVIE